MTKPFIKLTGGSCHTDNSMGYTVNKFDLDPHPTYIRPRMIESMTQIYHDGPVTAIILSGYDRAWHCTETPEQIMDMIAEIEQPGSSEL